MSGCGVTTINLGMGGWRPFLLGGGGRQGTCGCGLAALNSHSALIRMAGWDFAYYCTALQHCTVLHLVYNCSVLHWTVQDSTLNTTVLYCSLQD